MSSRPVTDWQPGWDKRLRKRLSDLGYDSVTAFVRDHPLRPLHAVARAVDGFSAVQLSDLYRSEAIADGALDEFARDLLVRELHFNLLSGWNGGPNSESLAAASIAHLITDLPAEYKDKARACWEALRRLVPPVGWLPDGIDDPLLVKAFREGWPSSVTSSR